jgi:integrase
MDNSKYKGTVFENFASVSSVNESGRLPSFNCLRGRTADPFQDRLSPRIQTWKESIMGVYKKKGIFWVDYRNARGRRKRKKIGRSQKRAEQYNRLCLVERDNEKLFGVGRSAPEDILFEEAVVKYMDWARVNKISWRRDEQSLAHWLEVARGKRLSSLSKPDVESYKAARKDVVAPRTVNEEVACLKRLYYRMMDWGFAAGNPTRGVKALREPPGRIKTLSLDEEKRLLEACPAHLGPVVSCALHTGMRMGEILRLEWRDVDLGRNVVIVRDSKNGQSREIALTRIFGAVLRGLPRRHEKVFLTPGGEPDRSGKGILESFKRAAGKVGIVEMTFHDLRHVHATNLRSAGADLADIKENLGHKTLVMTNRYAHVTNKRRQDVIRLLDGHYLDTGASTPPLPPEGRDA